MMLTITQTVVCILAEALKLLLKHWHRANDKTHGIVQRAYHHSIRVQICCACWERTTGNFCFEQGIFPLANILSDHQCGNLAMPASGFEEIFQKSCNHCLFPAFSFANNKDGKISHVLYPAAGRYDGPGARDR